jgi:hypothetical protein
VVLTIEECINHITHELGGPIGPEIGALRVVNQAGEFLIGCREWKFMERPEEPLNLRARISITGGAYNATALTYTKVGAFATYTFVPGDSIDFPNPAASTTRARCRIKSRQSADTIALDQSAGASNETLDAILENNGVELPSDFGEFIAFDATESLLNSLELIDFQELLNYRSDTNAKDSRYYRGAVSHVLNTTQGPPTARLDIWPSPDANELGALKMFYRARWRPHTLDDTLVGIPQFCDSLMVALVRAFAAGYEEQDTANVDQRLFALVGNARAGIPPGALMMAAIKQDMRVQNAYGPLRNGAAQLPYSILDYGINSTVGDPA